MAKRKVISWRQLPTRVPGVIWTGLLLWMFLDRLKVRDWIWGAVATIWVIVLVSAIAAATSEESADVQFKE